VTARRAIAFQDHGPTDVVTAVVIPMDGVSRLPVRRGVTVELWDPASQAPRPGRLIRNLSGHLVLVNEPADQDLTFRVDPAGAGYRGPVLVTFNPAQDGVSRVVALEPRPDRPLPGHATVVRGMVVRSGQPVTLPDGRTAPGPAPGVTVTVDLPPENSGHQFPATTDERGVFVLAVGLEPIVGPEGVERAEATIRFDPAGQPSRAIAVQLQHGRTHVFASPVDLDGTDEPGFWP
jgi:hypothetical protein